jgi:hypothetical protein
MIVDQRTLARAVFALTALAVLVAVAVQLPWTANLAGGHFATPAGRVFNMFCFFTVQSNVLVGVTTGLLAVRPERTSTAFGVFRLAGLVGITVTFVVFHVALASLQDLQGAAAFTDFLFHTFAPLLAIAGWIAFGPRGPATWRAAALTLLFPVLWGVFTLVRGPFVDFYPYPFIDVRTLGYGRVLVNIAVVGVLFYALAAVAVALDGRLPGLGGGRGARRPAARTT